MKIQLAKIIFLSSLSMMKKILDLIAFKVDIKSADYKYYKKEIMNYVYTGLKKLFDQLSDEKIIIKCECKSKIRQGYKPCSLCNGAGFKNK